MVNPSKYNHCSSRQTSLEGTKLNLWLRIGSFAQLGNCDSNSAEFGRIAVSKKEMASDQERQLIKYCCCGSSGCFLYGNWLEDDLIQFHVTFVPLSLEHDQSKKSMEEAGDAICKNNN